MCSHPAAAVVVCARGTSRASDISVGCKFQVPLILRPYFHLHGGQGLGGCTGKAYVPERMSSTWKSTYTVTVTVQYSTSLAQSFTVQYISRPMPQGYEALRGARMCSQGQLSTVWSIPSAGLCALGTWAFQVAGIGTPSAANTEFGIIVRAPTQSLSPM